jgi:hypothetical protein
VGKGEAYIVSLQERWNEFVHLEIGQILAETGTVACAELSETVSRGVLGNEKVGRPVLVRERKHRTVRSELYMAFFFSSPHSIQRSGRQTSASSPKI